MTRAKIVATIGPASIADDLLRGLFAAGADVARLNGSHATLGWHADAIARIRSVAPDVPILLDIPGRKIRTGRLEEEPVFDAGEEIVLSADGADGRGLRVGVTSDRLHRLVRIGDRILADDGTIALDVIAVCGGDVVCRAVTSGRLRSGKGINLPGVDLSAAGLTDRDAEMLGFARQQAVDLVGISFVDGAALVDAVREQLGVGGPRVVAKVESAGGMDHLAEVIGASDAIMVDRGDLSVETSLETIALAQKRIVSEARRLGRPVIIATEMLASMVELTVPTKAEVTDISNAILDGATAVMLSAETAIGRHPIEAVATMRRIADAVAASVVPPTASEARDDSAAGSAGAAGASQAVGEAVALLARTLPVTKIVTVTRSGHAASVMASYRPRQEILVVTDDAATARSANLLFGCRGVAVDVPFLRTSTDHIPACIEELWRRGIVDASDVLLVVAVGYPRSGRRMNLIETHAVADLEATLGWHRPTTGQAICELGAASIA